MPHSPGSRFDSTYYCLGFMDLPRRYTVLKLLAEKQCYRGEQDSGHPDSPSHSIIGLE